MDNKEIASEKGIKVLIGVFAFAFLFFIYYLASLMTEFTRTNVPMGLVIR